MSLLIWSAKLKLKPNGHNMFGAISTVQFWCFRSSLSCTCSCQGNLWSWRRSTNVNGGRKEYQSDILYMRDVSPVFILVTNLGVLKQLVFGHVSVWKTYSAKLQRLIDTSEIFWINMQMQCKNILKLRPTDVCRLWMLNDQSHPSQKPRGNTALRLRRTADWDRYPHCHSKGLTTKVHVSEKYVQFVTTSHLLV